MNAVKSARWLNKHHFGAKWHPQPGAKFSEERKAAISANLVGLRSYTDGESNIRRKQNPGPPWFLGTAQSTKDNMKGRAHSEETRQRLKTAWVTRSPDSGDTRAEKSKSRIGLKHSENTKRKISHANMGHEVSLTTRKKISLSRKLQNP